MKPHMVAMLATQCIAVGLMRALSEDDLLAARAEEILSVPEPRHIDPPVWKEEDGTFHPPSRWDFKGAPTRTKGFPGDPRRHRNMGFGRRG